MRFFAPPIGLSLHVLATWRKGGVQRSEAFGVFIDDACHGRGPRIRFELENGRLAETRSSQRAGPQLHLVEDSAGRILCVQRNMQS